MTLVSVKNKYQVVIPQQLRQEAPQWLQDIWAASLRRGTGRLTMREIDAEIAAARRARAKKSKQPVR